MKPTYSPTIRAVVEKGGVTAPSKWETNMIKYSIDQGSRHPVSIAKVAFWVVFLLAIEVIIFYRLVLWEIDNSCQRIDEYQSYCEVK